MHSTNASAASAAKLLASAHQAVADGYGSGSDADHLVRVALHLIECATSVVGSLPGNDLDAAHEALGSARAAVLTATYAVRSVHDQARGEQP
ncbi:hypothetical protein [Streptomyces sp. UNOC14_S4]|uniref:hypothetical protein n=1 Tax=Streptomyces sp. UNOC14_S4 TaxID=2872340 RepID=UPI001E41F910|nr:hypothetical protein [Streptomyces sp. UNOC14_S4]MCC3767823.1 hypothetical protein [Streptomyces sp. UNOC14_S4]